MNTKMKKSKMSKQALIRNIVITAAILCITTLLSFLFSLGTKRTFNITIFYILAVVLIARFTDGYIPGIIASVVSVICVNFAFTYPYLAINFSISGYPVTFVAMMVIASITSTTTTHLKVQTKILSKQEKMLMEAEKEKMRQICSAPSPMICVPL
ncbi:DUF4118 domain-containing protein [Clostridium sp. AM58-1XD]|uniref:DUF4118 domain-containing protein n=1 Tax=Clostridium sp. AM58-1XD TaxID=2292307 RepID=UPI002690D093